MAPMPPTLGFINARNQASGPRLDLVALAQSSLELDKRSTDVSLSTLSPLSSKVLSARDGTSAYVAGAGTKPANTFNNAGFQALFAILGAAMVIGALWFFFWAKNGGFHYQQGDWDDYKSTVLRRKGPDGKTLSNATKSTKLGGSTIAGTQHYKWQKQAAQSVVGRDEKGRKGVRAKRGWAKTHSVLYSDDYMTESFGTETVSDMTELRTEADYSGGHSKRYRDRDVQQYKKEKPARVGGLNRVADGNGSHFGTTIAGSETMSETSEQPLMQKTKEREQERAERKAREEAAKMERRWRREAEEAAAALARENAASRPPPPPAHTAKKSAAPSAKPSAEKQRRNSRSSSPKKRDFSYNAGPASEVLSTAYTATTTTGTTTTGGTRTASYYDEYRPRASENPRYSSDHGKRSRQSSPRKGGGGGGAKKGGREGGYRRGADSDLD
ncbi:hypothetical protein LTR36_009788 [Oleoguttula mirabilis]|uniref:Uncharacterized protein n=1 Tax=Oleoguttula mirabilis TaxID=1507867 RepID=A0AAV9J5P9_9PEZI|nr:hypothetical protein LTR36_009788 [Oleoguttula mirabilis]